VGDPSVTPCVGESGNCKEWSLNLGPDAGSICGKVELRIEQGAARAVHFGQKPSEAGSTLLSEVWPCEADHGLPVIEMTSRDCTVMYDRNFMLGDASVQHLMDDLHSMHLSVHAETDVAALWAALAGTGRGVPSCLIIPGLSQVFWAGHETALFEYVQRGGQLYVVGGRTNSGILRDVFGLVVRDAHSGNAQMLQTKGLGEQTQLCAERWVKVLPVLNQLVCVGLEAMAARVEDAAVIATGLYAGEGAGSDGFGLLEVSVGHGLLEYFAFDWHFSFEEQRRPWAMMFALLIKCNEQRRAAPTEPRRLHGDGTSWDEFTALPPNAEDPPFVLDSVVQPEWSEASLVDESLAVSDIEVSIAFECESGGASNTAEPSSCDAASRLQVLEPASLFYKALQRKKLALQMKTFAVPHVVRVLSPCADSAMLGINEACDFRAGGSVSYSSSIAYVQVVDGAARLALCKRPICRGMVSSAARLLESCPESAGQRGLVGRVVRAMMNTQMNTMETCLQVHSLAQGEVSEAQLLAQLETGTASTDMSESSEALEEALSGIFAHELRLPALALEATEDVGGIFESLLGGQDLLEVSDAGLRVAVQVTPLASSLSSDVPVSIIHGPGHDDIPITQKQTFQGAHNLQMLALQPRWSQEGVDPSAPQIRVVFEDVVMKDDPAAVIRVFPTKLR
ncbi:unnamed protein product, partial [Polarella glacialis]